MARAIRLDRLVLRSSRRADKQGDPHTTEWKALISEKYGELHSVVSEAGWSYFEATQDITANGAASYSLPAALLSLGGVDYVVNAATGERRALQILMPQERVQWSGSTGTASRFAFTGGSIELWPRPGSGTYRLTYIPQATDYADSADATELDVVTSDGEAFIIWGVAAMASDKGEADVRFKESKSQEARIRLEKWATNRALHEPRRQIVLPSYPGVEVPFDPARGWLT